MELRTYIVEDNATIRENLIGALEELASIKALGWADSEADATNWLAAHAAAWDLAIVDLFLKQGSGLGVLEACRGRRHEQLSEREFQVFLKLAKGETAGEM